MKIGIIKERKNPPDRRVPLSPVQCQSIVSDYPDVEVLVESSDIRCFTDEEYRQVGLTVVDDVSSCDVLLGVKEVPMDALIPDKTYFFFSHTIKEQPYNRDLLRRILNLNIRLIDYETLTAQKGTRLIGFGRYAGIVGAYNGFRAWGLRKGTFNLKPANACRDRKEVEQELQKVCLNDLRVTLTGRGRVAGGAIEILETLGVAKVGVEEYLSGGFNKPVYTQLSVADYNKRKDGTTGSIPEFFQHPELYESDFMRFARNTDMFIAGHYWDAQAPFLFTREEARKAEFNIQLVADISCDIDGPVASTIRPSTIEDPIYGYDPRAEREGPFNAADNITVMAVDNLPCELPRDASEDFGGELINKILPAFISKDPDRIIDRAMITKDGALTPDYAYLKGYVNG